MFLFIESRRFESFAVGKKGIAYGRHLFDFHEIVSVKFHRAHTTQYIYWTKASKCNSASMTVRLSNNRPIKISFNESYFFIGANVNKKEWIEKLTNTYTELCRATFDMRLKRFEEQLDKFGFFVYDGARFTPEESTVICKGKKFNVGRDQIFKSYGSLDFVKHEQTFIERSKRKVIEETVPFLLPRISTLTDTDVLFYLLRTRFGLAWPN